MNLIMFKNKNKSIKIMLNKNKSIEQKIKKKSIELLAASTSHGLPNVFRSKRIFMKVFWLGLFIISTFCGVCTVIETVNNYLKYEVVTKIDVITEVPTECKSHYIFYLLSSHLNHTRVVKYFSKGKIQQRVFFLNKIKPKFKFELCVM